MRQIVKVTFSSQNQIHEVFFSPDGLEKQSILDLFKDDVSPLTRINGEEQVLLLAKSTAVSLGKIEEDADCTLIRFQLESQ